MLEMLVACGIVTLIGFVVMAHGMGGIVLNVPICMVGLSLMLGGFVAATFVYFNALNEIFDAASAAVEEGKITENFAPLGGTAVFKSKYGVTYLVDIPSDESSEDITMQKINESTYKSLYKSAVKASEK